MESDSFDIWKNDVEIILLEHLLSLDDRIMGDYTFFCIEIKLIDDSLVVFCKFSSTDDAKERNKNVYSINPHKHLFSLVNKSIKEYSLKWLGLHLRVPQDYFFIDGKEFFDYESTYSLGF